MSNFDALTAGGPINVAPINALQRVPTGHIASTSNSSAIGTTETVVLTIPSTLYAADTAYEFQLEGGYTMSTTTNVAYWRLRKTDATGTIVIDLQRSPELTSNNTLAHEFNRRKIFTTGGSDVTTVLVLCLSTSAGTVTQVGNSQAPRMVDIVPISRASAYPDHPQMT